MFPSSPTRSSLFLPSRKRILISSMPCFRAHQLASPLPPLQEVSPLFATCHVSELTNPLLPLPPLQQVSPHFATCHISELTNPFLPLPPPGRDLVCNVPHFRACQPAPPSSSSPVSEFLFAMCRISKLTNVLLPPLQ